MPKKLVKPRKRKLKLVKSSSRLRAWSEGEEEGTETTADVGGAAKKYVVTEKNQVAPSP